MFAVQEEIAASIASALSVALTPAESSNLARDRPHDARAYDLYLKGRAKYAGFTASSMHEAMELFRQAVAIDPQYPLAWAGIADCYGQLVQREEGSPDEQIRLGLEAARRAIEIDPGLAEAYKAHALVLKFAGDRAGAEAALRKAIEMNPHYVPALMNLSVHAIEHADLAGAERLNRRALEIDPQAAFSNALLSERLWLTGRHEEAQAATDHLRRLVSEPSYITFCWLNRAWIHLARRDPVAARQALHDGRDDGADPLNLRGVEALLAALNAGGCPRVASDRTGGAGDRGGLHPDRGLRVGATLDRQAIRSLRDADLCPAHAGAPSAPGSSRICTAAPGSNPGVAPGSPDDRFRATRAVPRRARRAGRPAG